MSDEPTPSLLAIDVQAGDPAVLRLSGDLDPHTAPQLTEAIEALLAEAAPGTVRIDLGGVSFIDSSGLRTLVAARESLAERGAALALVDPTPNARRLLEVTGLTPMIDEG